MKSKNIFKFGAFLIGAFTLFFAGWLAGLEYGADYVLENLK